VQSPILLAKLQTFAESHKAVTGAMSGLDPVVEASKRASTESGSVNRARQNPPGFVRRMTLKSDPGV
jgi:hypothetical protein